MAWRAGNGWPWWYRFESVGLDAGRPHLVQPMFTTNFRIESLWLKDSAFWTLHPYACDGVTIRDLRITADPVRGHNTDGIDPDSTRNVLVEGCYVSVGDDAVAIVSAAAPFASSFEASRLRRSGCTEIGHRLLRPAVWPPERCARPHANDIPTRSV